MSSHSLPPRAPGLHFCLAALLAAALLGPAFFGTALPAALAAPAGSDTGSVAPGQVPPGHVFPGTERAFAGTFQLSAIEPQGNTVHLTMQLTLKNPGAQAVSGGIVAVFSAQPHPVLLGSFAAIKTLPQRGQVVVAHTFTISAAEYATWQHGHAPSFEFLVPSHDESGDTAIAEGIQTHQGMPPPSPRN